MRYHSSYYSHSCNLCFCRGWWCLHLSCLWLLHPFSNMGKKVCGSGYGVGLWQTWWFQRECHLYLELNLLWDCQLLCSFHPWKVWYQGLPWQACIQQHPGPPQSLCFLLGRGLNKIQLSTSFPWPCPLWSHLWPNAVGKFSFGWDLQPLWWL